MGSEMCIRDRFGSEWLEAESSGPPLAQTRNGMLATPGDTKARVYIRGTDAEMVPSRDAVVAGLEFTTILGALSEISDRLVDVTHIRIYFQGADRSTNEVHRENWTLIQDKRRIDWNLSATEGAASGGKIQRAPSGRNFYHVVHSFWSATQEIVSVTSTMWVEDEVILTTPGGATDQTARTAAANAATAAGEARTIAVRAEGKADTNTTALGTKADQADLTAEVTARTNADANFLNAAEIGALIRDSIDTTQLRPNYWTTENEDARVYRVLLHSGDVPDRTARLELNIHGIVKRVAYAAADELYTFNFTGSDAGNINRAIARDSEETIRATLTYQDGSGNTLDRKPFQLAVEATTPTDAAQVATDLDTEVTNRQAGDTALGTRIDTENTQRTQADAALGQRVTTLETSAARIPKAPRQLQAAVAGGDTAGVASVTLPTDFATFRSLTMAIWEVAGDEIATHDIRTAVIAAQRTATTFVFTGNPDATGAIRIAWNPATRVFAGVTGRNISAIRFIFAELHD